MSQVHLSAGAQEPPKVEGKLRLYSLLYCPYAQRPRLVLNAKKVPHDIVNINIKQKPDWYFKLNPEGQVPTLDTGSEVITESIVISDYLDEKYPDPPLYPKDPEAKNRDKELIKKIFPLTVLLKKVAYGKQDKSPEECIKESIAMLEDFENELVCRGTTFFGGEKPGMVDYMLWPWIERMDIIPLILTGKLIDSDKLHVLKKYAEKMKEDPATKATYHSLETHHRLIQKMAKGEPVDYDNL